MRIWAIFLSFFVFSVIPFSVRCQKNALRQPECLLNPAKEFNVEQIINVQCSPVKRKLIPWVVYSNRGEDFGCLYYVTGETQLQFRISTGIGVKGLMIIKPKDKGYRPKSEFLFHFSAEFAPEALIHRKCVVLNSQGLIDSICKGLIDESRIPVYTDPYVRNMINYRDAKGDIMPRFLPLYSIYFVYQRENNRYLLGRDYKFEPNRPFGEQIIGWVEASRVFDYNTRLCFEPNYEAEAVKQRRCDKNYGNAKVFSSAIELESFIKNPTSVNEPYWEEPAIWYLRQPNKFFISGSFNNQRFRNIICGNNCGPGTRCFFNAFTNNEEQSNFFRFPFLQSSLTDKRKFEIAVVGKYLRNWKINCDSLIKNKNILKVYFVFPDSLSDNCLVSFLRQFSSKYSDFLNAFYACFYPQQFERFASIGMQSWNLKNYNIIMDSLVHHKPASIYVRNEDCFFYLDHILGMNLFNERETNLIVLINTTQAKYPQNKNLISIATRLAKQNCYLLSFDFANNMTFNGSIDTIITKAISFYKERFALPEFPIEWELTESGKFLINYMLAVKTNLDTSKLNKSEIEERMNASFDSIISTINRVIAAGCTHNTDNLILSPKIARFKEGVEKIFSCYSKEMPAQGIFKLGYTKIRYDENNLDLWKGEVIMTETELQDLITQLDGVGIPQTGTMLCDRICTLWQTLISRFIGQQMLLDNSYLDLTICQIINRMVGSGFGYYCDEPVKRFTLRDICQGQQNVIEPAYAYLKEIEIKKELLKQKYNNEYFHISGEKGGSSSIKYYWVPVSLLP